MYPIIINDQACRYSVVIQYFSENRYAVLYEMIYLVLIPKCRFIKSWKYPLWCTNEVKVLEMDTLDWWLVICYTTLWRHKTQIRCTNGRDSMVQRKMERHGYIQTKYQNKVQALQAFRMKNCWKNQYLGEYIYIYNTKEQGQQGDKRVNDLLCY